MATAKQQDRWRAKQRVHSRQLNVMARHEIHASLDALALTFNLRGKADALAFACFVTERLIARADEDGHAVKMLAEIADAYHQNRSQDA